MVDNSSPIQELQHPLIKDRGITLSIKRDDLLHPVISGNKFRKLKYTIAHALETKHHTLLTFGGAYSTILLQQQQRLIRLG